MGGLIIAAVVFGAVLPAAGQTQPWSAGASGSIFYNGGNVGIGTTNPAGNLNTAAGIAIGAGGGVSAIHGGRRTLQLMTDTGYGGVYDNHSGYLIYSTMPGGWGTAQLHFAVSTNWATYNTSAPTLTLSAGNVGIGTISPQYKLAVNGTIGTKEVIVTNTGWADYVFQPHYRLQPLREVRAFIEAHQHLPGIPTEAEVKANGVGVGEMQAKLLAKIEELTLHMIRVDEQNRELRDQITRLERKLAPTPAAK
jgi:hypothetical protein